MAAGNVGLRFPTLADGRTLVSTANDIRFWDLASKQEVATLDAENLPIRVVAFLPDGNTLVAIGFSQLHVWRASPLQEADGAVISNQRSNHLG